MVIVQPIPSAPETKASLACLTPSLLVSKKTPASRPTLPEKVGHDLEAVGWANVKFGVGVGVDIGIERFQTDVVWEAAFIM